MPVLKRSHSVSLLMYHLVLVTKYRHKNLDFRDIDSVKTKAELYGNVLEIGYEKDHIHILIQCEPSISPMQLIRDIKCYSSKEIKKTNKDWRGWKRGYFISTVSENVLENVEKYIKNQGGIL